jgi:chemotaxis protein histidine kinase CheA
VCRYDDIKDEINEIEKKHLEMAKRKAEKAASKAAADKAKRKANKAAAAKAAKKAKAAEAAAVAAADAAAGAAHDKVAAAAAADAAAEAEAASAAASAAQAVAQEHATEAAMELVTVLADHLQTSVKSAVELVRTWDTHKTGTITRVDFIHGALPLLRHRQQTLADVEAIYDGVDDDGCGELDYLELCDEIRAGAGERLEEAEAAEIDELYTMGIPSPRGLGSARGAL